MKWKRDRISENERWNLFYFQFKLDKSINSAGNFIVRICCRYVSHYSEIFKNTSFPETRGGMMVSFTKNRYKGQSYIRFYSAYFPVNMLSTIMLFQK